MTTLTPPAAPLTLLSLYASTRATGELIAVGDGLEVHLYLQAGRIAWGTTTAERFVFRRHLVDAFHVEPQVLEEALVAGQRERRPLGETLVARGILTRAQVREGLRAQVVSALGSLQRCSPTQSLFLPRGANYASYDTSLTFALDELLPPKAGQAVIVDAALGQLQDAVPELSWGAVLAGREVLASVKSAPPAVTLELTHRLGADTDLLVVRASAGNLVAGTLPGGDRSVWCGLPASMPVSSALGIISGLAHRPRPPHDACARGAFDDFGDSRHRTDGLQEILERAICPVGAVVLERTGSPDLWAIARAPLDPFALAQVAAQRQRVLDADVFATRSRQPGAQHLAFQSVLVADLRWWWFGTDLACEQPASLWLALPRAADQGLGWALLATLVRHLCTPERASE